jgi:intracellular sulfur oxidation DsrE/DsrF family protein
VGTILIFSPGTFVPVKRPAKAPRVMAQTFDDKAALAVLTEQCSVAIRQHGTAADKVLPPIKVVGNSWISLVAYQTKGYAYIAP